jgi:hypothetical protein
MFREAFTGMGLITIPVSKSLLLSYPYGGVSIPLAASLRATRLSVTGRIR